MGAFKKKNVFGEISEALKNCDVKFNGTIAVYSQEYLELEFYKGALEKPSLSNLYLIGSISKQITAAVVLKILTENKISTEELIINYLPPSQAKFVNKVKFKHLFNHTAGILDLNVPLKSEPGEVFCYSPTLGYKLLTKIVEKISGQSFTSLLQSFLATHKMLNTGLPPTRYISEIQKNLKNFVLGFKETKNGEMERVLKFADSFTDSDLSWQSGGGYYSSAQDLARWNYLLHNNYILEKNSYDEFIKTSTQRNVVQRGILGYGYGIQILHDKCYLEYSHSGYLNGYTSSLFYYPLLQISLIILENVNWHFPKHMSPFCNHLKIRDILVNNF